MGALLLTPLNGKGVSTFKANNSNIAPWQLSRLTGPVFPCTSRRLRYNYSLNLATGKFTGYARHRRCRRINILQVFGNKADSVELQVPKGSKYEKTILMVCDFKNKYHGRNILFCRVKLFSRFAYARFRYNCVRCTLSTSLKGIDYGLSG
jgi:hypothetical protein